MIFEPPAQLIYGIQNAGADADVWDRLGIGPRPEQALADSEHRCGFSPPDGQWLGGSWILPCYVVECHADSDLNSSGRCSWP